MLTRSALLLLSATMLSLPAAPTLAQGNVEGRVGRLESEMRAVQRKVFPGGAGGLQPDIVAAPTSTEGLGSPASSAIVDVTQRVTSLEQQMATLTGQIEQNGYQLRTLREQFEAYKRATDARLAAATSAPRADPTPSPVVGALQEDDVPAPRSNQTRPTTTRPAATRPVAGTDRADDALATATRPTAAVPIARPSTGDPAEDSYLAGYRLWEAKRYPEAQAALKKTVADYPKSRRASYAQNLLGRAYLDDGKPSLASMAFYDNYKKMPDGERAPDSLLYLGQALQRLNKPADACKVYDELSDVYAGKLSAQMQADVTRGRTASKCK